ncbi:MAG: class I lanthipeptide [Kordia sp.]|uniref:class I lanthipeptide n=1 Tax=Kordia sp. TaxID=1965332 RepID=UPI00385A967A
MKTNFSKLQLNKKAISNLSDTIKGGRVGGPSDLCPSNLCPSNLCPSELCPSQLCPPDSKY